MVEPPIFVPRAPGNFFVVMSFITLFCISENVQPAVVPPTGRCHEVFNIFVYLFGLMT